MTHDEIVRNYREAKDKKKQIGILADLNECNEEKIISILKENGVNHRELPRTKKGEDKTSEKNEMNALEEAMSEVITEQKGEIDNLKGLIQTLQDEVGGYQVIEQDLSVKIQAAEERVRELEDMLADANAALESTEHQLDEVTKDARSLAERASRAEDKQIELSEKIKEQNKLIETLVNAVSSHSERAEKKEAEQRRATGIMMAIVEKYVIGGETA